MATTIAAIYEKGTLYLLEPLLLPESSRVQVSIDGDGEQCSDSFHQYLRRTKNALLRLKKQWSEKFIYETIVKLFQDELLALSQLCPESHSDLCAMLILATQRISDAPLTAEQIEVAQSVLDRLAQENVTESDLEESHLSILSAGLYFAINLDDDSLLLDTNE